MSDLRRVASLSLRWSVFGSFGQAALSIVVLVVLARYLGPEDFGVMALALGVAHVLFVFNELLFRDAIVQRRVLEAAHRDMAMWFALVMGVGFALASWFSAPVLAGWLGEPRFAEVFAVVSLGHVFACWAGILSGELERELQLRPVAVRNVAARLISGVVAVVMALVGYGVWSLVAQDLVMRALWVLLLIPSIRRWPELKWSGRHLREMLSFGLQQMPGQVFSVSARPIFSLIAGAFLGTTALGYINLAQRVVDTLSTVLTNAFNTLLLPLLARRQEDLAGFVRLYGEALRFVCFAIFPVFAGLAATAPWLMVVAFGAAWQPAVVVTQILAAAALVGFLRTFSNNTFVALGRPDLFTVCNTVLIAAVVIGMAIYGRDGAVEAAVVFAAATFAAQGFALVAIRRVFALSWHNQLAPATIPLIAALAMATAVLTLGQTLLTSWPDLITLATLVLLGAALYAILIAILSPSMIPQFFRFILAGRTGASSP
jgi:PST family polysaccharide transporter